MHTFITDFLKPLSFAALTALSMHSCTPKADAPLLEGKINVTEPTELALVYDYEGENIVTELTTDSTGAFTYNPALKAGEADLVIYVGQDLYGAFVKQGCSTHVDIDGTRATFTGDNTDRCRFNNTLYQSFSPWTFKPTPDHPFQLDEWNTNLQQAYERTQKAVEAVGDPEARARYQRLADATHKYYTLQILSLDRMMNQADNEAQTDSLLATIDPNADETRLSGLINYWYNQANLVPNTERVIDLTTFFTAQINAVDSALSNEGNKRSLYNTLTTMFFMYEPSDSDITAFRTAIAPQLAKAPFIAEDIERRLAERANQIKDGDALPSAPTLIARDGTRTTLNEVIRGKVAYIDFWATWCAPCCREIPYFEKVWKQYKSDPRIVFVSISQDDNVSAWQAKVDKDQPGWPNYIFEKISGRQFLDRMGINAIPRFIIVGRDGRIIHVNAARPSDKDIKSVIDAALAR